MRRGKIKLFDRKLRFLRGVAMSVVMMLVVLILGQCGYADLPGFDDVIGGISPQPVQTVDGVMDIHFIDVGQGDCVFIRYDEYTILIDAGENGKGDDVLEYLDALGVSRLTWVIGSHPHTDHIGGLDTVINALEVENVMLTRHADGNIPGTKTYNDLLMAILDNSLTVTSAVTGAQYQMGELTMTVLSSGEMYSDYNDSSIVLMFDFGVTDFITGGDISENVERDLLASGFELSAAVLKVSHHGSSKSSSEQFLDAVSAQVAVICCGAGNDYGHPTNMVLDRLRERNVDYYRTDIDSDVVVSCDGASVTVK